MWGLIVCLVCDFVLVDVVVVEVVGEVDCGDCVVCCCLCCCDVVVGCGYC